MAESVLVRGFGSIGLRHARVFASLGCRVAVWPVRSAPRGTEPGIRLLDDSTGPEAMRTADLVVIATDTGRHVVDTLEALDLGAARVLLEKPVAPSFDQAKALARHSRSDQVWVAAPLRATAAFRQLLQLIPSLGTDLSAHVWSQSWLPDWRPERDYRLSYSADPEQGGVLRDLVHELDYLAVLFGQPQLIGGALEHAGPLDIAAEQSATLLLRTSLAPAVTVRLDYITRPTSRGIEIRGANGALRWSVIDRRIDRVNLDGTTDFLAFESDADRDATMAVQARAALEHHTTMPPEKLRSVGAPATLSEGLATLQLCDEARAFTSNQHHEENS